MGLALERGGPGPVNGGGNPGVVWQRRGMPNTSRQPGLIQRYREELQARHYAKRTVATYEQ